jgi:hypothetical protein
MKTIFASAFMSLLLLASSSAVRAQEELTCEDYRCQFQQQLLTDCDCEGASNHGRFVSCVAHILKDLTAQGMPKNCKGKLQRCAARSVCGKQDRGFVTCTTYEYGTCVIADGQTTGICDTDNVTACTVDTDCVASTKCKTTRHADQCEADGGAVNLSPTCCSECVAPPAP